jgi:hypothetical protein
MGHKSKGLEMTIVGTNRSLPIQNSFSDYGREAALEFDILSEHQFSFIVISKRNNTLQNAKNTQNLLQRFRFTMVGHFRN